MFRRLIPDSSSATFMLIAFVVVAAIFFYMAYRVLTMRKKEVDRIANMPLGEDAGHKVSGDKPHAVAKDGMFDVEEDIADGEAAAQRKQSGDSVAKHSGPSKGD